VTSWPDPDETMLSILNTIPKEEEAQKGTAVFVESTARGVGDWFYNAYIAAKARTPGQEFEAVFIPWFVHDEYTVKMDKLGDVEFTNEETKLMDDHPEWEHVNPLNGRKALTPGQVLWRRKTLATDCGGDINRFRQEYPLTDMEAFVTSGDAYYDVEAVQARLKLVSAVQPVWEGEIEEEGEPAQWARNMRVKRVKVPYGRLKIWREPSEQHRYVIFADVSEGYNAGDLSVIDVFDIGDGFQCAQWAGHIDPDALGDVFCLCGKLYLWAWGAPEVRGPGLVTLQRLKNLSYPQVYQRTTYDKFSNEKQVKIGFDTNLKTRPVLLNAGREMFREGLVQINSPLTLQEMLTFVRDDNGKYQAQPGTHDDAVIAFSGACLLMQEGPRPSQKRVKVYRAPDEDEGRDRWTGY
jgi:hypothetical protein